MGYEWDINGISMNFMGFHGNGHVMTNSLRTGSHGPLSVMIYSII